MTNIVGMIVRDVIVIVISCSIMSNSLTPWTVACQSSLSMGLSWQEYWSGLLFPTQRNLSNPRIERTSLAYPVLADRFFVTEPRK